MKHDMTITVFLLLIFVLSQIFGLFLLVKDANIEQKIIEVDGVNQSVTTVTHDDTAMGPRPETSGYGTVGFLLAGIFIGTLLILLIIKLGKVILWKIWFFLAVTVAITISLGVLVSGWIALLIGVILAVWKIFKPNIIVHNISEVLIYAGIALLIVPMFKLVHGSSNFSHPIFLVTILLVVISIYDMWAVWKSKHMIKMAKFQTKSKVFAGLFIPYTPGKKTKIHMAPSNAVPKPTTSKNAILGGGDIAFPLIFSGVVMESLLTQGISKAAAWGLGLIVTLTTAIALFLLLYLSKKDRFYPAMPFVTGGCLVGYGLIVILLLL